MDGHAGQSERSLSPAERVRAENARAAVVAACDDARPVGFDGPEPMRPPGLARAIGRLSAGVVERREW